MAKSMLKVGFIGLGIMGGPMAANAARAGHPLIVYNRTAAKCRPFLQAGATQADTPAALASQADIILSCVSADQDVLEVLLDERSGVIAAARPGSIAIDCSTVSPGTARQCHQALAARGVGFLDAPISGGDVGAKAGTLSFMVGGDRKDFDAALPVLETMGKTVTYCGGPGAGYTVKLCNQIVGAMNLLGTAEAISLAQAAGVDAEAMIAAVSSGAASNWCLKNLGPKMLEHDWAPGFFIDYQLKDLRLAQAVADRLNLPLPGAALVQSLQRAASSLGHGRDGIQALYAVLERLRGNAGR